MARFISTPRRRSARSSVVQPIDQRDNLGHVHLLEVVPIGDPADLCRVAIRLKDDMAILLDSHDVYVPAGQHAASVVLTTGNENINMESLLAICTLDIAISVGYQRLGTFEDLGSYAPEATATSPRDWRSPHRGPLRSDFPWPHRCVARSRPLHSCTCRRPPPASAFARAHQVGLRQWLPRRHRKSAPYIQGPDKPRWRAHLLGDSRPSVLSEWLIARRF